MITFFKSLTNIILPFFGHNNTNEVLSSWHLDSMANSHSMQVKNYTLFHLKSLKLSTGLCTYFVGAEYCLDGLSSL